MIENGPGVWIIGRPSVNSLSCRPPKIAKVAEKLYVMQRSANWIMPRNRRFYSKAL